MHNHIHCAVSVPPHAARLPHRSLFAETHFFLLALLLLVDLLAFPLLTVLLVADVFGLRAAAPADDFPLCMIPAAMYSTKYAPCAAPVLLLSLVAPAFVRNARRASSWYSGALMNPPHSPPFQPSLNTQRLCGRVPSTCNFSASSTVASSKRRLLRSLELFNIQDALKKSTTESMATVSSAYGRAA